MALTRSQITKFRNLSKKSERDETGQFLAEGIKVVVDLLLAGFLPDMIITDGTWEPEKTLYSHHLEVTDPATVKKISALDTPTPVVAIFRKPLECPPTLPYEGLSLVLDDVQNPGNLGTIFRTADWFGISQIYCGPGCADPFGPKTVQAAMGSLGRVATVTTDLVTLLEEAQRAALPVYGAFLEGRSVYHVPLQNQGLLVMGHEGRGISPALEALITTKIHIPSFGSSRMESLNVAQATGILLSEFRRRI